MSQADVAKRAGIAGAYLCLLEKGRKPAPPAATASRIAKVLGLNEGETEAFLAEVEAARAEWKQWLGARKDHQRAAAGITAINNNLGMPAFALEGVRHLTQRLGELSIALKSSGIDLEALIHENGAILIPPRRP